MKLWLDDLRPAPDDFVWVKTAAEALDILARGEVTEISLDHDLGSEASSECGYAVAAFIEEQAYFGRIPPLRWAVHSANPVGRERMVVALENAGRCWRQG